MRGPKEVGAPPRGIEVALGAEALTPRDGRPRSGSRARGPAHHGTAYTTPPGAAGRGGRSCLGASCPQASLVPGVRDDRMGATPRHAPGRPKSDVPACQWIQRLHNYGLLTASFRPDDQVVVLYPRREFLERTSGVVSGTWPLLLAFCFGLAATLHCPKRYALLTERICRKISDNGGQSSSGVNCPARI